MRRAESARDGDTPLFVLVTRLFVHFKFRTRKAFDPSAALIDDDYAREVLVLVRAVRDARLQEIADRFERARFGALAPKATGTPSPHPAPRLDLSLEESR